MQRRTFLVSIIATGLAPAVIARGEAAKQTLGHGGFKYRVVPRWGVLGDKTPVEHCHGIVETKDGHIVLLTTHIKNNVIVYDAKGKLQSKWTLNFPGAHGLSIVTEGKQEVLFITCIRSNTFVKTTLEGKVLAKWGWPSKSGKYQRARQYKPSWTLHKDDGEFFVLDGYGKDYIQHFDKAGQAKAIFGGKEGGITHWGPHGGIYDDNGLLIAMSDQQYLMKLDDKGKQQFRVQLPGGNPRQIQRVDDHYFVTHLADNWPKNRDSRGYISVLDKKFKVIANLGGTKPEYDDAGKLKQMKSVGKTFIHPHDSCVAKDGSVYVAQFLSNNTYPIKLERV